AEDGIRDFHVTGVQTCALPISGQPTRLVRRPPGRRRRSLAGTYRPAAFWSRAARRAARSSDLLTSLPSGSASSSEITARSSFTRSEERRVGKERSCRWEAQNG